MPGLQEVHIVSWPFRYIPAQLTTVSGLLHSHEKGILRRLWPISRPSSAYDVTWLACRRYYHAKAAPSGIKRGSCHVLIVEIDPMCYPHIRQIEDD